MPGIVHLLGAGQCCEHHQKRGGAGGGIRQPGGGRWRNSSYLSGARGAGPGHESRLEELGLGFKGPRVIAAARQVTDNLGELERLKEMPYPDAKRRLMEYDGIGPKIADCICLMALDKVEAFPVDRHIRRAVEDYVSSEPKATDAVMVRWAQDHFGSCAGYAGQYFFLDQRQS